ncbi:MAG: hypothetical protein HLUCCA01_13420 [Bacteroidetes bacterium HLUCCA01]|nr:MAG: hypothetical protein HLUCCA01_13420 [Bacteroidetes bacterium HLUCCA01]
MKKSLVKTLLILPLFCFGSLTMLLAQSNNVYQSQNFRLGEAHYRVAEPTQIADTILVWGDVQLPGTYLVPRGINLAQMLAYARGPIRLRTSETDLDWSKVFIEVNISNRDTGESMQLIQPVDGSVTPIFFEKRMENFDTVIIRVRRQPNFLDYVRAYSPVVGTVLNTLLLYRTIRDL